MTPGGTQAPHLLHRFERGLVIHAREGLAHVEGLAVPVELAVIVRSELRSPRQLAGQQPARQRNARQNAHLLLLGLREEQLRLDAAGNS